MRIIYYFNKLRSLIFFKESINEGNFELHRPKIEDMSNIDSFVSFATTRSALDFVLFKHEMLKLTVKDENFSYDNYQVISEIGDLNMKLRNFSCINMLMEAAQSGKIGIEPLQHLISLQHTLSIEEKNHFIDELEKAKESFSNLPENYIFLGNMRNSNLSVQAEKHLFVITNTVERYYECGVQNMTHSNYSDNLQSSLLFANSDYLGSGRVQNITSPPIALPSDSFEFKVNFNNEILNYISKNRESFSRTVKFLPINEKEDDLSLVIPDIVDMDQEDI